VERERDDEYQVLNKDDIPTVSEYDRPEQKSGGWPKQMSNVRWISAVKKDEKPDFQSRSTKR
jgi:hypothetical protein